MAILSPHFKELRDSQSKIQVNELWMNALCQMCYELGSKAVDKTSYDAGYEAAMKEVANKLGFEYN
jgi:hypothetical protein